MPSKQRCKTKYPGVYYIESTAVGSNKTERIYYIVYRKDGKIIEEKAGRQFQDDMTPARAAGLRAERIEGKGVPNKEKRAAQLAAKLATQNRWTVGRLFEEYMKTRPLNKAQKTDKGRYENYLKPIFGSKEPREILPLDVDRLRIRLQKERTPQTVKHVLNLLTWIVNFGIKKGLCQGLSFQIKKPFVNNEKTEDLTPDQLARLMKAIDEESDVQAANLMRLALFTGMRRGELFKLQWDHIDFERQFITLKDPKGGPDQKIPLNDAAKQVLWNHPRTKSPYVFPGKNGRRRTDIKRQVNRIKKKAELPGDFRPLHGLRHAYASMLASSGQVDLYTLQKLLTHKSPKMTQRYAHLRDEALKKAADLAGSLIEDAVGKSDGKGSERDSDNSASNSTKG